MLGLLGVRARQSGEPAAVREFVRFISYSVPIVLIPAMAVVFVSGLWMVWAGSEFNLTQSWVITSIIGFVAAVVIAVVYLGRIETQLVRLATASADTRALDAVIRRWLVGYALLLAVLVFVLWNMVFKPGVAS
jgi:hypothetical protein